MCNLIVCRVEDCGSTFIRQRVHASGTRNRFVPLKRHSRPSLAWQHPLPEWPIGSLPWPGPSFSSLLGPNSSSRPFPSRFPARPLILNRIGRLNVVPEADGSAKPPRSVAIAPRDGSTSHASGRRVDFVRSARRCLVGQATQVNTTPLPVITINSKLGWDGMRWLNVVGPTEVELRALSRRSDLRIAIGAKAGAKLRDPPKIGSSQGASAVAIPPSSRAFSSRSVRPTEDEVPAEKKVLDVIGYVATGDRLPATAHVLTHGSKA